MAVAPDQAVGADAAVDRPASEGMFFEALVGVLLAYLAVVGLLTQGVHSDFSAIVGVIVYAAPQVSVALKRDWDRITEAANLTINSRVMTKLLGLLIVYIVLIAALLGTWTLGLARFGFGAAILIYCVPGVVLVAIPYVCTVDRADDGSHDAYFQLGRLALGDWRSCDARELRKLFLGWFIKGFFTPLMLWEYLQATNALASFAAGGLTTSLDLFNAFNASIYFIDVLLAVSGYIFTLRLLRWEIRTVNPNPMGWFVTLICYYPFFGIVYRNLLEYQDGERWNDWLSSYPLLLVLWGLAIAALKVIWIMAVLPFGLRFSNLTNRGIFTNGAFLLGKHPSYVAKNCFFWLIHVPFLSGAGTWEALENSAQLAIINLIYFLRAQYEERHLWEEPRYRAYARWIAKNGLLARARKLLLLSRRFRN